MPATNFIRASYARTPFGGGQLLQPNKLRGRDALFLAGVRRLVAANSPCAGTYAESLDPELTVFFASGCLYKPLF
jgi:hypothetical protein